MATLLKVLNNLPIPNRRGVLHFASELRDRLCNRLIHPEGPEIRVTEAMFFIPATDEKPFAFVQELFDLRASIMAEDKDDVRAVIHKLAINSIYGKLAQSVGRKGVPPAFASPWMAAAIPAGTRRMLVEAA
jgi:hypothetical protein